MAVCQVGSSPFQVVETAVPCSFSPLSPSVYAVLLVPVDMTSGGLQDALLYQIELAASVHTPPDQHEARDRPFDLPVAMRPREPRAHGGIVVLRPAQTAATRRRHPLDLRRWSRRSNGRQARQPKMPPRKKQRLERSLGVAAGGCSRSAARTSDNCIAPEVNDERNVTGRCVPALGVLDRQVSTDGARQGRLRLP